MKTMDPLAQDATAGGLARSLRAANLLLETLVQHGVDTLFGLPGGSIAPVYDALHDFPALRMITTRLDGNAVFAAAGYAFATGKLGVVTVTSGPGVFNCVNAIASAHADGLPLLVIAGEAPRIGFGRGAIQEGSAYGANIVEMLSRVTKLSLQVHQASALPGALEKAIRAATAGRPGPAFLSIPLDVQGEHTTPQRSLRRADVALTLPPSALEDTVEALRAPGRKLILVGAGAKGAGTKDRLIALVDKTQIPLVTTPKGKGAFPEDHPLCLGVFGMGGHASAREYVRSGCAATLVLGSSLNEVGTDGWQPALCSTGSLIHVEIDPQRIGRSYATDVAVVAPVDLFLDALLPRLEPAARAADVAGVSHNIARGAEEEGPDGRLSPVTVLRELQAMLPAETFYTTDSGNNLFFAIHYLEIPREGRLMSMLGMGSMGTAIPNALGVKLAEPGRPVCAITGDGGFLMAMAEVGVAVSARAPLVVVVMNDRCLAMVQHGHTNVYGRTSTYSTEPLDVPSIARGLGAGCAVLERPSDFAELRPKLVELRAPLVIDARITASAKLPPNSRFDTVGHNQSARR